MQNVLDCTPIPQFAIGIDHRITCWNRACELLTGFSAKEMVGTDRQWAPFYPDKRPVLADIVLSGSFRTFQQAYQGKAASASDVVSYAWQATDYFENLGGLPRHVLFVAAPVMDASGTIVGAVETLQDISRQVRAERDLRDSEERYRLLTEKVADGILLLQDRKIRFANRAVAEMLGYEGPEELVGQKANALIHEDFRGGFRAMSEAFEAGELLEKIVKIKCIRIDGREIWVEAHNEFIQWDGKPAVLTTIRDITVARHQEMEMAAEAASLRMQNRRLQSVSGGRYRLGKLIGKSECMQEVYDLILKAAGSDDHVMITGESGTGKELAARAIHELSDRNDQEFVPVNCGAIPESLMESEFFGHKRGAFTGAVTDTHGYLSLADRGVLFMDEVGDLPPAMQVKLLRAIEGREYAPVGSSHTRNSDCRIVAATNQDLKGLLGRGLMREDFFYRMHVIPMHLPPLRDRKEDIPLLVEHFLGAYENGKKAPHLSEKVMEAFYRHDWPGNVRELENMLRRYMAVGQLDFLYVESPYMADQPHLSASATEETTLADAVERFEKDLLVKTLEKNQWHKARAAATLGISRRTLFRKLRSMELS